jgi:hypothetical protein
MAAYSEEMGDIAAVAATCTILEQAIQEELNTRSESLAEYGEISKLFEFGSFTLTVPRIQPPREDIGNVDYSTVRIEQKLAEIRTERNNLAIIGGINPMELEAALEIARSGEAQWNLKSAGSLSLRTDLQRLQKLAVEGEFNLKQLTITNDAESQRLARQGIALDEEERIALSNLEAVKRDFESQNTEFDEEIEKVKEMLSQSTVTYDNLCEEMDGLVAPVHPFTVEEEEQEQESEEESSETPNTEDLVLRSQMEMQRSSLKQEVEFLKTQLKEERNRLKTREAEMKEQIVKLRAKCRANRTRMRTCYVKTVDSSSFSTLRTDIASIIGHIDSSILEMQAVLAS